MVDVPAFCRLSDQGLALFVRLTPRSARDAIEGPAETAEGRCHLKVRVRAVPENGRANTALEKLLAREIGVPRNSVSVTGGATTRLKTVEIQGMPEELLARIGAVVTRQ
ncbi:MULTISPECIES: DUF167 family protein [unclassified Nitratireductor]|uniref:DUF167 family protein n=1 Tax=unclassified Nitratireductor TaxID=2641084 RepID=UPI0025DC922F|nr:DUF167 family protein [Nitratireductor sp.]